MTKGVAPGSLDVGIVVVTYNSADVIGPLLASLDGGLNELSWSLVVVDNGSSDDTVALVRAAGFEVMAIGRNLGYAAAINRGTHRFPDARSILVLNPDVELEPGSVAALLEALTDPGVGVAAPKVLVPGEPPHLALTQRRAPSLLRSWGTAVLGAQLAQRVGLHEAVTDPRQYDVAGDIDWAVGAVLLCSRNCVDIVGDWDESYFLYSEEVDFCHRARQVGLRVRFTPGAVVLHREGASLVDPRLRSMMSVNRVREYGRRHGILATWCFYGGAVVHESLRGLAGNRAARAAAVSLLSPRRRPPEIGASTSLVPR